MSKDPGGRTSSLSWGHSHSRLLKRNREAGLAENVAGEGLGPWKTLCTVLGDKTR